MKFCAHTSSCSHRGLLSGEQHHKQAALSGSSSRCRADWPVLRPDSTQARRGRGIGSRLVRELVQRAADEPILLTTLKRTIPFYGPHGFSQVALDTAPR